MATKKKELLEQELPAITTTAPESEDTPAGNDMPENAATDTGNELDLNELLGQMDEPMDEDPDSDVGDTPLPELSVEDLFDDSSTPPVSEEILPNEEAALTEAAISDDVPEDTVEPVSSPIVEAAATAEDIAAPPKPKRASRKKKEVPARVEDAPLSAPAPVSEEPPIVESSITAETVPAADTSPLDVTDSPIPPSASAPQRRPRSQRAEASVLTIRSRDEVETAEDRDDAIWHEIHNAYRTHKIITGQLGGIEQLDNRNTVAVVDYKGFRVIIPLKEMMINLGRSPSGQDYADLMLRQNKILGNMLGADIDFIVRGIDSKTRSVVASRREAMLRKRQIFYLDTDANGMYRIYEGRIAQARIIAVAEKVIRVEVFGVETSILARDLAWDWIGDAHERFSVGDEVLVRILNVRRNGLEDLSIKADIKSISENTDRDNLQKCRIQGKYAGKVTDVHKGVVYVRLSNGVNAVAHSCYDYRLPGKKDDVSFAVTRLDVERGVAVGIITRIIRQNL